MVGLGEVGWGGVEWAHEQFRTSGGTRDARFVFCFFANFFVVPNNAVSSKREGEILERLYGCTT